MDDAKLRHLALTLQTWLIDINFDTELTAAEGDRLKLTVHNGFGYHAFTSAVYICSVCQDKQLQIEMERTADMPWVNASMRLPPLSIIMGKDTVCWTTLVTPDTPTDLFHAIISNMTRLFKQVQQKIEQSVTAGLRTRSEVAESLGYTSREARRSLAYKKQAPPRPPVPTRKKYP